MPKPNDRESIISLAVGGHVVLNQLETVFECERCRRETLHHIVYLGRRIAEVRCRQCGQWMGMDREEVVRALVGEIVLNILRFPQDVSRELRQGVSHAVLTLPRQMVRLPFVLAQEARRLLQLAWNAPGGNEVMQAIWSQVDSVLFCTTCNKETLHRILYLGHRLAEARCAVCRQGIVMSREEVLCDFVGEAVLHLLRFPQDVRRELRSDFSRAVQTLPRQMVHMPFWLAKDFIRLVRILRAPMRQDRSQP